MNLTSYKWSVCDDCGDVDVTNGCRAVCPHASWWCCTAHATINGELLHIGSNTNDIVGIWSENTGLFLNKTTGSGGQRGWGSFTEAINAWNDTYFQVTDEEVAATKQALKRLLHSMEK